VYWLVLAALGDALTAIVGCAGLLAGVWLIARSSRADAGVTAVSAGEEPATPPAPAAAGERDPDDPPSTTFRHGTIRLVGDSERQEAAVPPAAPAAVPQAAPAPEPEPAAGPEPAPEPEPSAAPKPAPEPEPEPSFVPPPLPPAPRTSFRPGRIRLGGLEHGGGSPRPADERPDEPPDAA
jgi:outer membrane biosynthesis protein TonB